MSSKINIDLNILRYRGILYQEQKRYEEAIQSYRSAVHYRPRMASMPHFLFIFFFTWLRDCFLLSFLFSGSFKHGSSPSFDGHERWGDWSVQTLFAARWIRFEGPTDTRDHQDFGPFQSGSSSCWWWSLHKGHRRLPWGYSTHADTLPAPGDVTYTV